MPTNPALHPKERESLEAASTLRLTVTPPEEFHDDVSDAIEALERGDDVGGSPTINFPTYEELASTFTPSVIELLETIRREGPSSINETARLVDRDVKNVHTELSELAQLHVIYFEEDGQAKQPVVWFDEIRFEIDMPAPGTEKAGSGPA